MSEPIIEAKQRRRRKRFEFRLEIRMLFLTLILLVVLSLSSKYFLTYNNIMNVLDQSVVVGILAVGQTAVVLTGGIDLSVGALLGFGGMVLALSGSSIGFFRPCSWASWPAGPPAASTGFWSSRRGSRPSS